MSEVKGRQVKECCSSLLHCFVAHSRASHSHTVCMISSAIKQCTIFLTCLGPVRKRVHVIIKPHTPSSMVWQVLLLETFKTAFVCLLIYCNETVHFVPVCCLAIWYIQFKMVSFPPENVQSVQFVDVSSLPECCFQGPTQNQKRVHAVKNKS